MKKLLAMVLALVMTLSLAVSANAFKDDKSISDDYAEAVAVLNGMGVFKGYEDGSFQPKGNITRAEVSAIVYRVYTQDVKDAKASMYATYNKFSDMAGAGWAQGYIGYCANAELVKGYPDGTFKPSGKVTGYEVLAMILRAVGYDKNGEFSGADWALHVAQTAQQAGVLKNVKGIDLNAPATRELVAELLFRAIAEASTVTYTPAFGYVTDKVLNNAAPTLGYKNFKLVGNDSADVFGRPATKWIYNVGDKSTLVVDKPVVSYTTKVDECDIAKDLGITSAKAIEGAYIDGASYAKNLTSADVTSNRYATINPLATTSYVGAQGRLTEVYDMGTAGYRIVEINTYLAQVTKVTPAYTDRNSHTTVDTVDLKAYTTSNTASPATFTKVEASGFTVGQYVLVTISNVGTATAAVESVVAAEVVTGGKLTGWTNEVGTTAATTVVAGTTYKDSNKFFLNYRVAGNWMVATDTYGNAIGLVESASNYLAVARIEWKANATSFGGYALADVVLANGEVKNDVTIASVNGNAANATGAQGNTYTQGVPASGSVSIYWTNNSAYYNHIMAYSVNADGSYNLMNATHYTNAATKSDKIIDLGFTESTPEATAGTAYYNNSTATIGDRTNNIVATDNTVFLYVNDNGYSYTVYTGKNNAPSITAAKMCVKFDSYGYAELVVVRGYTAASNTFIAYVTDKTIDGYAYPSGVQVPAYTVYKMGSLDATTVYDATVSGTTVTATSKFATAYDGANAGHGLYKFEVTSDGYISSMTLVMAGEGAYNTDTTNHIDRATVKAPVVGNSFQTAQSAGTPNKDFNVLTDPATAVIKVVKYNDGTIALAAGTADDITTSSITVLVNYDATASLNKYNAKTVYVVTSENIENPNPSVPANVASIEIKSDKSVYMTLDNTAKVGDKFGFTVEKLGDNGYVKVGDYFATVQGNTKAAWVDMSKVLSNGTYRVTCGVFTDEATF